MNDLPTITPTKAAQLLNCSAQTVVNLANRGDLPCVRDSSNRRLFTATAIEHLKKKRDK
jgi:excisionase family DNA binding protein